MRRFGAAQLLPVRPPFRLDLTVDALRRLASNAVDVVASDGVYYRALAGTASPSLLAIRAHGPSAIELRATGRDADRWLPVVARMLGTDVDLREWYARSRGIAWLTSLAKALRGLGRHAILRSGRRARTRFSFSRFRFTRPPPSCAEPSSDSVIRLRWTAFDAWFFRRRNVGWRPTRARFARPASRETKSRTFVRRQPRSSTAHWMNELLERLPTVEAAERLRAIRGIGAWSASVVLLRGLGRLDTFPLRDSGVARSLALVSGDAHIDQAELLDKLGPVRGMLYYHLLLGRQRSLTSRS